MYLEAYLGGDIKGAHDFRSNSKFAQHIDGLRGNGLTGSSQSHSQAAVDNNLKAHNIWVDKTDGTHNSSIKGNLAANSPSFDHSGKLKHVG